MIRAFGGRRIGVMALAVLLALCALAAAQGKPKIAVYVTGAQEQSTNKALGTMILTGLVSGGQYQMVERSEEFQKQLEAEHVKQRSGAIADDQIKALGMQFGVDFVCIADITPVLGAYLISARIVNVETAQVVDAASANSPLKTIDDLSAAVAALFGAGPAQNQQAKSPAIAAFERGNAAKMNKNYDLAIAEYTEAIRLDPSNSDTYYFARAQVYKFNKKDNDNAIADYSESIRLKPSYVRYYTRGDVYLEKGDYAKAIADYEESLRLKPDNTAVKDKISVARGRAGVGGGSVADAPKPQAQSASVSGDNAAKSGSADVPKAAFERGKAAYDNKNYDLAIREYTEAIRLDPNNDNYYFNRAVTYHYYKEDYDKAIADYTEAIRLKSNHVMSYYSRGGCYMEKGNYTKAIADYNEYLRLDPKGSFAKSAEEGLAKARQKTSSGNSDFAKDPKAAAKAAFERGQAAQEKKDYDLAIREYTEAIKLDPNNDNYYFHRAVMYSGPKQNYDKGIADYTEAIRINPGDFIYYFFRGDTYLKKEDYAKAIADYGAALGIEPGNKIAKKRLAEARKLAKRR